MPSLAKLVQQTALELAPVGRGRVLWIGGDPRRHSGSTSANVEITSLPIGAGGFDPARPWATHFFAYHDLIVLDGTLDTCVEPRAVLKASLGRTRHLLAVVDVDPTASDLDVVARTPDGRNRFALDWLDAFGGRFGYRSTLHVLEPDDGRGVQRCAWHLAPASERLEPLLMHVHIPKTAGQAFNDYLARNLDGRLEFFYPKEPMPDPWPAIHEVVNREPKPLGLTLHAARSCFPETIGTRLPLYVSFLRDPYAQIVSYLKYIKMRFANLAPAHRNNLPPNCDEMSVQELLDWHIGSGNWGVSVGRITPVFRMTQSYRHEVAMNVLRKFTFVGIQEQMDRSVAVLAELVRPYGFELRGVPSRINSSAKVESNVVDLRTYKPFQDFRGEQIEREYELYRWAVDRFERQAEALGL